MTLTYEVEPATEAAARSHVREYLAVVGARAGRRPLPWLFAVERGDGGRLHAHVLLPASVSRRTIKAAWRHGHVHVSPKARDNGGIRNAASYLVKEDRAPGSHRYIRATGFDDEKPLHFDSPVEAEAFGALVAAMQGVAPDEVRTSEDWLGWRGPPVRVLFWWEAAA